MLHVRRIDVLPFAEEGIVWYMLKLDKIVLGHVKWMKAAVTEVDMDD